MLRIYYKDFLYGNRLTKLDIDQAKIRKPKGRTKRPKKARSLAFPSKEALLKLSVPIMTDINVKWTTVDRY
ncbi:hypothetical protein [Methanomethylovorans sp.]|uniref:hypothetical protein n=1 Tax=Methanomethylovorans sp. TaxID=2758717 RepID=UPI000AEF61D0|nr:hypothetical protein [Methanomethylovorans sp.]